MTDCPETHVQILVHISAPSGAKDDARYRKQAEACLGFATARSHIILRPEHRHAGAELAAISAPSTTDGGRLEAERYATQPASDQQYQGHAGPSACALPSPFQRSSLHDRPQTAPSAATPPFTSTKPIRRTQSDSWGTPPSVVPDSQPLVPAPANASTASTASPVRPSLSPRSPVEEPSAKRRRIEPTAVLPPTISALGPLASSVGIDSRLASVASHELPSALSPSEKLQSRPTRPSSQTTPTPQIQVLSSREQQQPPPSNRPLRTTRHHPSPSPLSTPPHSDALTRTETLTIHPPPPPTASKPFKTHITASLALVAKHADLPKRYQPTLTARPLRPLERGHWRLDCTSFPPLLRTKMWKFLADFVGQGRAGWGVWCELSVLGPDWEPQVARLKESVGEVGGDRVDGDKGRGDGLSREGGGGGEEEKENGEGKGRAMLKVYCWGEVVPHVYVVLFLATSRMVKGAGACWVDGAGEVVVRMP